MTTRKRLLLLGTVGIGSFALAFGSRSAIVRGQPPLAVRQVPRNAPDSLKLAAMGIHPGEQLVAYVLLASSCSYCQEPATKHALRSLRTRLRARQPSLVQGVSVIGVTLDANIQEGLDYLKSVGVESFDEISVGGGWANEHLIRLVWGERGLEAAVPQIVLVARHIDARAEPLDLSVGKDSLVGVLSGRNQVVGWIERGALGTDSVLVHWAEQTRLSALKEQNQ